MKNTMFCMALALTAVVGFPAGQTFAAETDKAQTIIRNGEQAAIKGSAQYFTGNVRIDITVEERKEDEEFTAPGTAPAARTVSYEFALRNPGPYYVGRDGITLLLDGRSRGFVPVPYSAFASKEDLQRAEALLTGDT